jgi:hypothetical protein
VALSSSFGSFSQNPFPDVGRAGHQSDSFSFARTQEPYNVGIHDRDFAQVENNPFSAIARLCLQFLKIFRSDSADQSDDCRFLAGLRFNLQRSRRLPEDVSIRGTVLSSLDVFKHCISMTIRKLMKRNTWARMLAAFVPKAQHIMLKLRLVPGDSFAEFGSETPHGVDRPAYLADWTFCK